jgi:hypothetical protein
MTVNKHELLLSNITKMINLHGEYVYLSCSNMFLKNDNYILTSVNKIFSYTLN